MYKLVDVETNNYCFGIFDNIPDLLKQALETALQDLEDKTDLADEIGLYEVITDDNRYNLYYYNGCIYMSETVYNDKDITNDNNIARIDIATKEVKIF